jgi:hypothetical protein
MAESLQTYLTTKTWTRAEWNAAQTNGTEGGFVADATQRTTYEQYLKNAGFKDEAEAMAKRAEQDASGAIFGAIQNEDVKKQLAERKITPEYAKELDDAQAKIRAEEAKRVALLSKGYITGQEPVYIPGTPENKAFWEAEIARARSTGTTPEPPDAYLDAQAFAARYELYNRYGATKPTYNSWNDAKKQYEDLPNPYYNPEVLVPKVGMGNDWYKLERQKWSTVKPGVGSTAATETANLAMESFFQRTVGGLPAGYRFFMRVPGDIAAGAAGPTPTPIKTRVSSGLDSNGNFVINYSDGSKQVTDKKGVITTTSSDGKVIPNDTAVDGFGKPAGWMLGDPDPTATTKTVTSTTTDANGNIITKYSDGSSTSTSSTGVVTTVTNATTTTNTAGTKTLVSTQVDSATGDTIGYFSDGSQNVLNKGTGPVRSQEFKDSYALLESTFRSYGLDSLVPTIQGYMDRDLGPEQAAVELRTAPEYIERFKGNQLRLAAGKNALSEDVYLLTEKAYDQTLTSYGQANYFGIDRKAKQAKMAVIIGNDINADEFRSRVDLAVARVSNADPTIKKLLKDFYPNINDADLVGYFLNPAEGLPKLTEKVTSAEIGSAFLGQGLAYTREKSTELAQYGIDRAGALKGAADIKEVLPESEKFTNIYGESGIKYNQQTAEEEFLKDNQDAATKRKRLASMERGSFSGSAGNAPGAYSTGYLKKSSTAGLI